MPVKAASVATGGLVNRSERVSFWRQAEQRSTFGSVFCSTAMCKTRPCEPVCGLPRLQERVMCTGADRSDWYVRRLRREAPCILFCPVSTSHSAVPDCPCPPFVITPVPWGYAVCHH